MGQVAQGLDRILEDPEFFLAGGVGDKADTAGVVFELGPIQGSGEVRVSRVHLTQIHSW
jgi:hypothetical protein